MTHPAKASEEGYSKATAQRLIRESKRVFVAYSHADYRVACDVWRRVVRLRQGQHKSTVFMDQEQLTIGSSVKAGLTLDELRRADLALVLCGRETPQSTNVMAEIRQALTQRQIGQTQIIPIILGRQQQLPEGIADSIQGIFLTNLFPEIRWQRWAITAALAVTVLAAAWFSHSGTIAKKQEQETHANKFLVAIGTSGEGYPSEQERDLLWELAELDKPNTIVREKLLLKWAESPEFVLRAVAHESLGLHASVGLNQTLNAGFSRRCVTLVTNLCKALKYSQEKGHHQLIDVLVAAATRIATNDAAVVAPELAEALVETPTSNSFILRGLADSISIVAMQLDPYDAVNVGAMLVRALEPPEQVEYPRLSSLADAFQAVAVQINTNDCAKLASDLAKALEKSEERNRWRLQTLSKAFEAAAARLGTNDAATVGTRLAEALESSQGSDGWRIRLLSRSLAVVAARMNFNDASQLAGRGAIVLAKVLEEDATFVDTFVSLAARMGTNEATAVGTRLAEALGSKNYKVPYPSLPKLGLAVKAVAARLNTNGTALVSAAITKALENPRETDHWRLSSLSDSLSAIVARMSPEAAANVGIGLAKALEIENRTNYDRLLSLAGVLVSATERMSTDEAAAPTARGVIVLAKSLENPKEEDEGNQSRLASALAALAVRMGTNDAAAVSARLFEAMRKSKSSDAIRLSILGEAMAATIARMSTKDAAEIAGRGVIFLAKALANPEEEDRSNLSRLASALAALAVRTGTNDAVTVCADLAKTLGDKGEILTSRLDALATALVATARVTSNCADAAGIDIARALAVTRDHYIYRLSILSDTMITLAPMMSAESTSQVIHDLTKDLESIQDDYTHRLSSMANVLAALGKLSINPDVANVAARKVANLAKTLENSQELDADQLSSLANAVVALAALMSTNQTASVGASLTKALKDTDRGNVSRQQILVKAALALAKRMSAKDATILVARGAMVLTEVLENPRECDGLRQQLLAETLLALPTQVFRAPKTSRMLLSVMLVRGVSNQPGNLSAEAYDRKWFASICGSLTERELVEVLKWPFCVGDAQKLILAELERKREPPQKYNYDLWKFVEQAPSLGIPRDDLNRPAVRPRLADAIMELTFIQAKTVSKP